MVHVFLVHTTQLLQPELGKTLFQAWYQVAAIHILFHIMMILNDFLVFFLTY